MSEWLMEFSVLWAVFPLLDQLIEGRSIFTRLTAVSAVVCISALLGGILLRKGEH